MTGDKGSRDYQGHRVDLTQGDLDIIQDATSRRGKAQRRIDGGTVDTQSNFFDPQTMDIMERTGVVGEYGFSKFYNLQPPYVSDDRLLTGDRGYDYAVRHIPTGEIYTIEVKSTDHEDGNLLVTEGEDIEADIYILCIVRDSNVYIIGGAENNTVKNAEIVEQKMTKACRLIPREELLPPPEEDELDLVNEAVVKTISIGEVEDKIVREGDVLDVEDSFKIKIEEIH